MTASDYPNDADGDALRRLLADGSMSKPMKIDFAVSVPDQLAGEAIATRARSRGYEVEVVFDPGEEEIKDDAPSWTCYCTCEMVPAYDAVIAVQLELDQLSREFGGYSDGWGSFGNNEQA